MAEWFVQLVRSLPTKRSEALPRFEPLSDFFSRQSWQNFPSLRGRKPCSCVCWELTCDGLVFGVIQKVLEISAGSMGHWFVRDLAFSQGDSKTHSLDIIETGDKHRLHGPLCSYRIF